MFGLARGLNVWVDHGLDVLVGSGPRRFGWLRASTFGLAQGLDFWVGLGP